VTTSADSPAGQTQTSVRERPARAKVLLVDDDPMILAGLRRQLHRRYEVFTAEGGSQGLDVLAKEQSIAAVISDMRMPGMDGATFLAQVRTTSPLTTRILLTGQTELSAAIRAINDGQIFRLLNKPCPPEVLNKCLQEGVVRHEAARDEFRLLTSVLGDRRVLESHGMYEAVAAGLQVGLENHEFRLQYQPIVALSDERIIAVEALVRWAHPDGGLVQAASFVPTAESTGLIMPLGRWVMVAACQEVASWPELTATRMLQVHINLSDVQLRDPGLVDDLAHTLILSGLDPHRVAVEVDVGPALDDPAVLETLRKVAASGIHLALGVSIGPKNLLGITKKLPFDMLKISGQLSALLPNDENARRIFRALVAAATGLRLRTVAVGIETAEQQEIIRSLGCELAQGYLYGRPTGPDELLTRLVGEGS
jgi:EAL domain-containing protein (putative c-di-GMP-specific phosphodiesterase class I)/ActR/RegA family two-component response regulator